MVEAPRIHLVHTEHDRAALAAAAREGERVGLSGLLDDLGRQGRRAFLGGRLLGRAVRSAFTWDAEDRRDPRWWPQGITTSADAGADAEGHRLVLTSWYARDRPDDHVLGAVHGGGRHGSRITVVDLDTLRYEHVLLVTARPEGEPGPRWEPLRIHAGGMVWLGEYVHLAATARGLMTCRLDDILRVDSHLGHRYVLPVHARYDAVTDEGFERLRYSFVALDRSADPVHLVVGEYGAGDRTQRLARYPVDAGSGLLAQDEDGIARPLGLDEGGEVRMQGAVTVRGTWYVQSSNGSWGLGSIHVGSPGAWRTYRWATPMGPEDISWWPETDTLWSVSEHPRRRWVYTMDRRWFDR